jgi:hypothetical protein
MYCTNCGLQNADTATICSGCGASLQNPYQASPSQTEYNPTGMPNVPTYLAQSILVTLFCCVPFGIVAIVYAAQVSSKLAAGDYQGAMNSSNSAKMWCWIGFAPGLIGMAIWIIAALTGHGEIFFHVHRQLR